MKYEEYIELENKAWYQYQRDNDVEKYNKKIEKAKKAYNAGGGTEQ